MGEVSGVMQVLRLFIEVVDEAVGLDKMKDNFSSLTLVLDTMLDYGYPAITEKSVLVSMLQKSGVLDKAQNAIYGSVSDRHSTPILNAVS
jgi:hypothetical protein